jgi:hypothetical protein
LGRNGLEPRISNRRNKLKGIFEFFCGATRFVQKREFELARFFRILTKVAVLSIRLFLVFVFLV